MKIQKITFKPYYTQYNNTRNNQPSIDRNTSLPITNGLEKLAALNKTSFTGQKYELGLSEDELQKRTSEDCLKTTTLLSPNSPEYQGLKDGDKKALKHLVRAANIIGEIELQLDDENNIPFRKYLEKEIAKGNQNAVLTKKLFDGQKGIFSPDHLFKNLSLAKNLKQSPGRGVYPRDLTVEEFHKILKTMIEEGKDEEVRKILTQRSVVERDGKYLKGIDYVDKFQKEFKEAADELEKAVKTSTDENFNEYLRLQAAALRKADPMLDAAADIKWATLQDTPLEFTITRENYEDKMTETIFKNEDLLTLLKEHGITPVSKDFLGGRVGIVNPEGTEFLKKSKEFLPELAKYMPYSDEYLQVIDNNNNQTMVDVDLVQLSGQVGEYRGKITIAENLPNDDKLAIKLGGGRRNAYHRQIRQSKGKFMTDYSILLDKSQLKHLKSDSGHYFTVGHENAHSLGPKHVDNLGEYKNIIEENKADVAAIAFTDLLTELGLYTEEERNGILTYFILQNFLYAKPDTTIAHRVRQVMQCKYFGDNGAYDITKDGKIHVNIEKVVPTAKKILDQIIRIQKDDDYKAAEAYVKDNFVWTDDMEFMAGKLRAASKTLNGTLETPLADYLARS